MGYFMAGDNPTIYLSEIDEQRFGIKTAKASLTASDIPEVLEFCSLNHVELLIARCPTTERKAIVELERQGCTMMDTLVYYSRKLKDIPHDTSAGIRPVRPGEELDVRAIATESFKGYPGHYHNDDRLDAVTCDDIYTDWAYKSCLSKGVADEVLVSVSEQGITGFATMKSNSPDQGEGVLFGVAPWAQGRGIYRLLMISGMQWCVEQGHTRMMVSTQITNISVQKVWTRLGFEPSHSFYTVHKWFAHP